MIISIFIYSCQNPYVNTQISKSSSTPLPTLMPSTIIDGGIPTKSPSSTSNINSFPCTKMSRPGKNFSINCSYSIDMSGYVRDKINSKGIKSTLKIERDGKTNIIETSNDGYYEIPTLFFGTTYKDYGTYKFTISSPNYVENIKVVTYGNGELNVATPIDFYLEPKMQN